MYLYIFFVLKSSETYDEKILWSVLFEGGSVDRYLLLLLFLSGGNKAISIEINNAQENTIYIPKFLNTHETISEMQTWVYN